MPFQFQPAKRDEQLKERLEVEYPAILRWAIDGWLDMQAEGAVRPAVIVSATKEYLDDENVIADWLTERCELGPLHEVMLKRPVRRLEDLVRGGRRGSRDQPQAQAPPRAAAGDQLAGTSTAPGQGHRLP